MLFYKSIEVSGDMTAFCSRLALLGGGIGAMGMISKNSKMVDMNSSQIDQ
jgi:hypothetical protein